jgi:hypothetical protein
MTNRKTLSCNRQRNAEAHAFNLFRIEGLRLALEPGLGLNFYVNTACSISFQ